eukprot:14963089-Alexandrium_andersonii.AAC.1
MALGHNARAGSEKLAWPSGSPLDAPEHAGEATESSETQEGEFSRRPRIDSGSIVGSLESNPSQFLA